MKGIDTPKVLRPLLKVIQVIIDGKNKHILCPLLSTIFESKQLKKTFLCRLLSPPELFHCYIE